MLILKIHKKVKYLCLYGYIKCRNRFITNYKLWIQRKRSCNAYPLPSSAIKLMRECIYKSLRKTNRFHEFIYPVFSVSLIWYRFV